MPARGVPGTGNGRATSRVCSIDAGSAKSSGSASHRAKPRRWLFVITELELDRAVERIAAVW